MNWARHVAHIGRRAMYTGFRLGELKKKTPLGKLRHRWEDNIKMDIKKEQRGLINLVRDRRK
jgi:hypothetical protein